MSSSPLAVSDIPQVLPGIELNAQQWVALQALEAFVYSGEKLCLLTGYAGTGKSTLLQALITRLRQQQDNRPIALTALSNKATKVLAAMAYHWGLEADCMTCCRLLGLRPTIDKETGKQRFEPDRERKNLATDYALVIVDECSMINQEMWELLVGSVSRLDRQTQILFVGDPAQLPPVGETESPCFQHIYQRADLTDVVRYGGTIGAFAAEVRMNLERSVLQLPPSDRAPDNTEGIFVVPRRPWEQLLLRAFTSEAYQRNPDQVRVLAYTNRRVRQLNQMIRAAIYGDNSPRFVVGERLIANNACLAKDGVIMQTSEECEVVEAYETTADGWRVWTLEIVTEEGRDRKLRVLHESEQKRLKTALQDLSEKKQWQVFWDLKQFFHDVNYAYSLTVHKSQGSTFQDVFVDVPNLMLNRQVSERNQLCYVAFTRAAKRLFLLRFGPA